MRVNRDNDNPGKGPTGTEVGPRFQGQVAIVTGSSAGIGQATAWIFAREGAQVLLNARGEKRLSDAQHELAGIGSKPVVVRGDISQRSVARRLVETAKQRFGRIDILVNNAGGSSHGKSFEAVTEKDWRLTFRANLQGAFFLCQAVVPLMKAQGYGRIVNVSSLAGRQRSLLAGSDYASAKAGLLGLTRQMAWELGPWGITVNAVAPGVTLTHRITRRWRRRSQPAQSRLLANIPLRRLAQPEEVARVIAFLASHEASYVTGVTLDVNGGSFMA